MKWFLLYDGDPFRFGLSRWDINVSLYLPPARELIRNRSPDSDGVFRIRASTERILYDDGVELGSDGVYRINSSGRPLLIEIYGVPTRISMNRQEDGVEIVCDRGQLQSAPTIDGPVDGYHF